MVLRSMAIAHQLHIEPAESLTDLWPVVILMIPDLVLVGGHGLLAMVESSVFQGLPVFIP